MSVNIIYKQDNIPTQLSQLPSRAIIPKPCAAISSKTIWESNKKGGCIHTKDYFTQISTHTYDDLSKVSPLKTARGKVFLINKLYAGVFSVVMKGKAERVKMAIFQIFPQPCFYSPAIKLILTKCTYMEVLQNQLFCLFPHELRQDHSRIIAEYLTEDSEWLVEAHQNFTRLVTSPQFMECWKNSLYTRRIKSVENTICKGLEFLAKILEQRTFQAEFLIPYPCPDKDSTKLMIETHTKVNKLLAAYHFELA